VAQTRLFFDGARLLHDLQRVNEIAQAVCGNLEPDAIARQVTDALVEQFDCAFARIWLLEPDQRVLRLVASSGLYTHLNGSFARVPMGAYKVGKIAQNRVPFLSNQLPEESWVKDRQWAIDNQIQGFAGYPLRVGDRVLGVLATFSHHPFAPEFLEVLQVLCMTVTVALDAALKSTRTQFPRPLSSQTGVPLSDHLATILGETRLLLVGTERPLPASLGQVFVSTAEILRCLECRYCRLTYAAPRVTLEAIVVTQPKNNPRSPCEDLADVRSHISDLKFWVTCLGGTLQTELVMDGEACQILIELPCLEGEPTLCVRVQSRSPLLQQAFTQLAYQAGLTVGDADTPAAVLITDSAAASGSLPTLWICHDNGTMPNEAIAGVDVTTTAEQLRHLVEHAIQGTSAKATAAPQRLSSREQQVMRLLAEGQRDRNIARALFISESTVKFHINNSLTKLNAKNRYQGVYQAAIRGWI